MTPIEQYIRDAAVARGIDPNVAVRVASSEGGLSDPTRRSDYRKGGYREPSYGPFQLLIGGDGTNFPTGMGNRALAAGIDPRDPNQWQRGVDFALDDARKNGWGAWYGAKAQGITGKMGIGGVPANGLPAPAANPGPGPAVPQGPRAPDPTQGVQPSPADVARAAATPPAWNEPGGFLSQLGGLLMSSAEAAPMQAPSLSAPAHNPNVNSADPLGMDQGNVSMNLFDQMLSGMDNPAEAKKGGLRDVLGLDIGKYMSPVSPASAAPAPAADSGDSSDSTGPGLLKRLLLGRAADPNFPGLRATLGQDTGKYMAPGASFADLLPPSIRPDVQGPPMSAMQGAPQVPHPNEPAFAPAAAPAPVQGPPMPGYLRSDYQGPPMSAAAAPVQGPPMPGNMRPDYQGPPMSAMQQGPADPVLPDTAPVPTPRPNPKKFDTLGFLQQLGLMTAALGGNSPEVKPANLSAPIHNPQFNGIPMPRGLL